MVETGQRLPSLTGLRFFLAASVLATHLFIDAAFFADPGLRTAVLPLDPLAACAVSGFFVLSGFVLAWTHRPGEPAGAFWRRRLWRIGPAHALGWLGAVAFAVLAADSALPNGLPLHCGPGFSAVSLLLLQGWAPHLALNACFNSPSWSISCEVFFYALFPLLIAAARRLPARRLGAVWTVLAVAVLSLPLPALAVGGPVLGRDIPLSAESVWLCYFFPPARLAEFALGIVTARLLRAGRWPRVPRTVLLLSCAAAAALTPFLPAPFRFGALGAVPLTLLIAHLARADAEGRSGLAARPALIRLGEASYALYILHWPLLLTVRQLLGEDRAFGVPAGLVLVTACALLAQGTALLAHRFVERPLAQRFSRRHSPAPAPPGEPAGAPST
ncbi:acyltransferase family protein [Streptomyces paromomycinus]|uniref:acyltransferase family protein n=1 Tax=Streptomyces paromomycinus TaxID=92743 RepID=UPI0014783CAA|nr:acyltransferase [Streptomyces paromomycinus]